MDPIGFDLDAGAELDAREALEDEVGGAVFIFDGGAYQAEAGDDGRGFTDAAWFLEGDGEHAIAIEDLFEHEAVTLFENEKRQHCLGEQDGAGQRHYGRLFWQVHE